MSLAPTNESCTCASCPNGPERVLTLQQFRALKEEIRVAALLMPMSGTVPPVPYDSEGEYDMAAVLAAGLASIDEVHPLRGKHLAVPLCREVLIAVEMVCGAGLPLTGDRIAMALKISSFRAHDLAREIDAMLTAPPRLTLGEIRDRARHLLQYAAARQLRGIGLDLATVASAEPLRQAEHASSALERLRRHVADCDRIAAVAGAEGGTPVSAPRAAGQEVR